MYKKIYKIVNEIDPMGIGFCADDEYEPEVKDICNNLHKAKTVDELTDIIYGIFNRWFYTNAVSKEDCSYIADDIWELLNKEQL